MADGAESERRDLGPTSDPPRVAPLIYKSIELFEGHKEIFIEHDNDLYSLRITSKDKLLLTK